MTNGPFFNNFLCVRNEMLVGVGPSLIVGFQVFEFSTNFTQLAFYETANAIEKISTINQLTFV
jgi:trehalose-6-phosphate synthase